MAAAVVQQIVYLLKLTNNGTVTFNARKMENYQTQQQLNHNQTEASALVDEITNLVRKYKKSGLWTAAVWREAAHLLIVILQPVHPSERLRLIQIQAGGAGGLYYIARQHLETYRHIIQSVSSDDERLQLPALGQALSKTQRESLCQATQLLQKKDSTSLKESAT